MPEKRLRALADRAGSAAHAPDFAEVARRGRRRRRTLVAASGVAAAALIAVSAVGVQSVYDAQPAQVPPANTGTTTTKAQRTPEDTHGTTGQLTAQEIVHGSKSRLADIAVSPRDADVRAALWIGCGDQECKAKEGTAFVVTSDAFKTAHYVRLPDGASAWVQALPTGEFVVSLAGRDSLIVDSTGNVSPISPKREPAPLGAGEELVNCVPGSEPTACLQGLDPRSRTSHPIPRPDAVGANFSETRDGTIWGVGATSDYSGFDIFWSTDHGASWQSHSLGRDLYGSIPSAAIQTMAAVDVGDDAVLLPVFHRSTDGGKHWQTFRPAALRGATAYWAAIRPDGSLLVSVVSVGGSNVNSPSNLAKRGLYVSHGTDWNDLRLMQSNLPLSARVRTQWGSASHLLNAQTKPSGSQALYITAPGSDTPLVSTDGGHTWTTTPAR